MKTLLGKVYEKKTEKLALRKVHVDDTHTQKKKIILRVVYKTTEMGHYGKT